MNLKPEELEELNGLLRAPELDLPSFRRTVGANGSNFKWLARALKDNDGLPDRLKELLKL